MVIFRVAILQVCQVLCDAAWLPRDPHLPRPPYRGTPRSSAGGASRARVGMWTLCGLQMGGRRLVRMERGAWNSLTCGAGGAPGRIRTCDTRFEAPSARSLTAGP